MEVSDRYPSSSKINWLRWTQTHTHKFKSLSIYLFFPCDECRIICPSIKCLIAIMDLNLYQYQLYLHMQMFMLTDTTTKNVNHFKFSDVFFRHTHKYIHIIITFQSLHYPSHVRCPDTDSIFFYQIVLLACCFFPLHTGSRAYDSYRTPEWTPETQWKCVWFTFNPFKWMVKFFSCYDAIEDLTLFTLCASATRAHRSISLPAKQQQTIWISKVCVRKTYRHNDRSILMPLYPPLLVTGANFNMLFASLILIVIFWFWMSYDSLTD